MGLKDRLSKVENKIGENMETKLVIFDGRKGENKEEVLAKAREGFNGKLIVIGVRACTPEEEESMKLDRNKGVSDGE